jgi:putative transposase
VIEDLDLRAMTRSAKGSIDQPGTGVRAKAGLNRAILAQGWGKLRHQLAYKLARRGGKLILVDARYTSQECVACGTIDSRSRPSQAAFRCVACGHRDHADVNAARVLLARAGYADREDRGRTRPWQRAEPSEIHGDEARTPRRQCPWRPDSERESSALVRGEEVNRRWLRHQTKGFNATDRA